MYDVPFIMKPKAYSDVLMTCIDSGIITFEHKIFLNAGKRANELDLLRSSAKHIHQVADDASLLKECSYAHLTRLLKHQFHHTMTTGKKCHQRQQECATGGWMVLKPAARCFAHVATGRRMWTCCSTALIHPAH
jgi:hypothetical protein